MSELKPCPFKFLDDVRVFEDIEGTRIEAVSSDNLEYGITMHSVLPTEETIKAWNALVAPKVKALEWRTPWVGTSEFVETECSTIIGLYQIDVDEKSKRYCVSYSMMGVEVGLKEEDEFESIEEAKAAAQSHYEKQILEALE